MTGQLHEMKRQSDVNEGQLKVMNRQLDVAVTEQRAWVKLEGLDIQNSAPMSIADGNINLKLALKYKNFGKTLAREVRIFIDVGSPSLDQIRSGYCQNADSIDYGQVITQLLFPDEPIVAGISRSIHISQIKSFNPTARPTQIYTIPTIAGCISYKSSLNVRHHTWFRYELMQSSGTGGRRFIDARDQVIDPSDLILSTDFTDAD
jgi:hypothetical protein